MSVMTEEEEEKEKKEKKEKKKVLFELSPSFSSNMLQAGWEKQSKAAYKVWLPTLVS